MIRDTDAFKEYMAKKKSHNTQQAQEAARGGVMSWI